MMKRKVKSRLALFFALIFLFTTFSSMGVEVYGAPNANAAPAAPTGLLAEAGDSSVILTWDDPSSASTILKYMLEYKDASSKWVEVPINDASATTYTVGNLKNDAAYKFRLKVQGINLKWSDYSEVVSATPIPSYTVTFDSKGGGAIAPKTVFRGSALGDLPVPKAPNSIFLGWYTDDGSFNNAVSQTTIVTGDMILYARYATVAGVDEADKDVMASSDDCETGFALKVLSSNPAMSVEDVKAALKLDILDNTDFAGLAVSFDNGQFTVTAINGYTPGSSYKLTLLSDALCFADEPESVRTYCFSIRKQAVLDLKLNGGIIYIPAAEISDLILNGVPTNTLSVPLASVGSVLGDIGTSGTFTYNGAETLAVGDILSIYEGIQPDLRTDPAADYSSQKVAYVEIVALNGTIVTYQNTEAQDVLFIPDILPVNRNDDTDGIPDNHAMTIAVSQMTYTGAEFAEMGLDASTVIETGDFLAFYDGSFGDQASMIAYGRIITVELSDSNYVIAYADVTADELKSAMDIYSAYAASGEQMLQGVSISEAKAEIKRQVIESGFADAAAAYLAGLAKKTDGFKKRMAEDPSLTDTSLEILSTTVDPVFAWEPEHFGGLGGLSCAVHVFVEVACGDMTISLDGTFEEVIRVAIRASGGPVWRYKWRIFPYIADYRMTASIDLGNYTGIEITASIRSTGAPPEDSVDIGAQIEALMAQDTYESEEIAAQSEAFYTLYQEMLQAEHDYIELFSTQIMHTEGPVDPLHILVFGLTLDFVVNADVNVSLGSSFVYEKATRYVFSLQLFAKRATSDQIELVPETYDFSFSVMGTLGLRAGILVTAEVGLFSLKAGSIGIQVETGPYLRMWGYFYYNLHYANRQKTSTIAGVLYLELGIYLKVSFLAQAFDSKYFYNPTLYENEFPLWDVGSRYNIYDFAYKLTDSTDDILFKGDNTTFVLPPAVFSMNQLDLKEGVVLTSVYSRDPNFTIAFTNSGFSEQNGVIMVNRPLDQDWMEGLMTVYWNGAPLSFSTVPMSRTFHLVWDNLADSYTISFDSQGGSLVSSISGAYQSAVTLPEPVRAGYTFGGWYLDAACTGNAYTTTSMPAMNIRLYAKWTANTDTVYTVKHYQQTVERTAYELIAGDTQVLTGQTDTTVTPTVKDYAGFTAPVTQTVTISGDGATVVEYLYTRNSYLLTFKLNNGEPDIVRTVVYGASITAPVVSRTGYRFLGWYSDAGLTNAYTLTTMPPEHLTLYAGWISTSVTSYKVEHYQENLAGAFMLYESEYPSDIANVVKTYVGFTNDATLTVMETDGTRATLKLFYRRNSYSLIFDANGGAGGTSAQVKFGAAIEAPTVTWTGHVFNDWDAKVAASMPDHDLTYTAQWLYAVAISTQLSTGVDARVPINSWVNDTITLAWTAPEGVVPTGSLRVIMKTPGLWNMVIYDQPIAATASPLIIKTSDQGLSEKGLYQFEASYIPAEGSLFAGAVSAFGDEQVTVTTITWQSISVTGFNHDMVANDISESVPGTVAGTTDVNFDMVSNVFYENGFSATLSDPAYAASGLPRNRIITSGEGHQYTLADYRAPNVLALLLSETGQLTLTTPGSYASLHVLATASNGFKAVTATVHYSDGTTSSIGFTVLDWYGGTPYVVSGLGRINIGDTLSGLPDEPRLYEYVIVIPPDAQLKTVVSVDFLTTESEYVGNAHVGIFALSGMLIG